MSAEVIDMCEVQVLRMQEQGRIVLGWVQEDGTCGLGIGIQR